MRKNKVFHTDHGATDFRFRLVRCQTFSNESRNTHDDETNWNKRVKQKAKGDLTLYGRMYPFGYNFAVGGYGFFKKLDHEKLISITKQQRIYRKKTSCLLFSGSRP